MSNIQSDLLRILVRELQGFERELALYPDDKTIWRTMPGVTNSTANLALHVAGNLQHYVGAVLGGTGYVRDRTIEFARTAGTRRDVIAELTAAMRVVEHVLPRVTAAQLESDFPEAVAGITVATRVFLVHLCAHAAFHLGQAGYMRRILMTDSHSSGPLPLSVLA
jgi:uncharacterized damage-inducible protein DinB